MRSFSRMWFHSSRIMVTTWRYSKITPDPMSPELFRTSCNNKMSICWISQPFLRIFSLLNICGMKWTADFDDFQFRPLHWRNSVQLLSTSGITFHKLLFVIWCHQWNDVVLHASMQMEDIPVANTCEFRFHHHRLQNGRTLTFLNQKSCWFLWKTKNVPSLCHCYYC